MKIFNKALEISRAMYPDKSDSRRCFHWSFLFERNKLICVAENIDKTHSRNRYNVRNFDVSMKGVCSELQLFIVTKNKFENFDWRRATLVNVRIDREGNIKNSKACPACSNLIKYLSIKNVYHTNDNGEFEKYSAN